MNKDRLYDLAAAAPLVVWLALGAAGSALKIFGMLDAPTETIDFYAQAANVLFLLLAIALLLTRRPAIRKAAGLKPRFAGFIGCIVPFAFPMLPHRELPDTVSLFLASCGFVGTVSSIFVLFWLGRSFSILPQARGLVTEGPYRYIRHPLYLAEFLLVFSRAFELAQPWPFVIIMIAVGSQISRMHYEEQILSETFPAYREYMRHTARLIPGVY